MSKSEDHPSPADDATAAHRKRAKLVEGLYREHHQSLLRFLASRLRSEQEARDVAQEAYIRLLRLEAPELIGYLRAFLFKTASNIAIDRLRSRQAEFRTLEAERAIEVVGELPPERTVAAIEELGLVAQFIGELPPRCRQAFLLRRLHDLSSVEIARRLDIPERTVRHYVVEAIVYCRSRLDGARKRKRGSHGE